MVSLEKAPSHTVLGLPGPGAEEESDTQKQAGTCGPG